MSDDHTNSEREDFRLYVVKELRAGDKRMDEIAATVARIQEEQVNAKALLAENTETIKQIQTNTHDMLQVFESWKGAMRALEMIGKLARPLGYITAFVGSVVGIWVAIKNGGSPK